MKNLLLAVVCFAAVTCEAQNITTVTTLAIAGTVTNSVGGLDWAAPQTNSVFIPNGQAARVASIRPRTSPEGGQLSDQVWFEKNGVEFNAARGDVIAGPAVFYLRSVPPADALLSLERWTVKKSK